MTVLQLDHVNIRSLCLRESVAFYTEVLGMAVRHMGPGGAFILDAAGRGVVHLVATERSTESPEPVAGVAQRGLVDHYALQCRDPEVYLARIQAHGLTCLQRDVPMFNLHQIVLRDPNGVLVELSFQALPQAAST